MHFLLRWKILLLVFLVDLRIGFSREVTTYNYDVARTGVNAEETLLTPQNVNISSFGQIFDVTVEGQIYAQPLYLPNVNIPGKGTHNVVYVATMHDALYALDADTPQAQPLWYVSYLGPDITTIPQVEVVSGDVVPEIGILSTPVIDSSSGTMYLVVRTRESRDGHVHYIHKLHAVDVATGEEKFNGPTLIADTICDSPNKENKYDYVSGPKVPKPGATDPNDVVKFNALRQNQRAALTLLNGIVYVAWASHGDAGPYHGWLIGFDAKTLQLLPDHVFNTTPKGSEGGFWQGGCGPSVDEAGNLYLSSGNGDYDGKDNWSMTVCKFSTADHLRLADYFTPKDWKQLNDGDTDLGSSGAILLPDHPSLETPHLLVAGGKQGIFYLLNRDKLGHFNGDPPLQIIDTPRSELFATAAFFNETLFYNRNGDVLKARKFVNGKFADQSTQTTNAFDPRGGGPVVSAAGTSHGIVWMINNGLPASLMAYDADALTAANSGPIYSGHLPGNGIKFVKALVVNGKVYAASANVTGATSEGHLSVFGSLEAAGVPAPPSNLHGYSSSPEEVKLSWTNNGTNQSGFIIQRKTGGDPFQQVGTAGATDSSYTDQTVKPQTSYQYRVQSTNANASSSFTDVFKVSTAGYLSEPGLVAYWPCDEGTGQTVLDYSGHGHLGILTGEVAWADGQSGRHAVNYHGTGNAPSNITVANNPDLCFSATQSFTISAWARPTSLPGHWAGVVTKSRELSDGWYGIYLNPANQWTFRSGNDTGDLVGTTPTLDWQLLVAVQDGSTGLRTLYVDGKVVAAGKAQDAGGTGVFMIGQGNAPLEGFAGSIDEVRVYNRALSANELTKLSPPVVSFARGFGNASHVTLNGTAKFAGPHLVLTDGGNSEKASAFFADPVNIQAFATEFSFQITSPNADGLTFTIQGQGANALGGTGESLGYAGITKSLAIKFDLCNNSGEGPNSTGVYRNGVQPEMPADDLGPSGVDLHSGHIFKAQIVYNGSDLKLTLTDTETGKSFSKTYATPDLATVIGANQAYVGFTAATGGLVATIEILSWTYSVGPP